MAGDTNTGKPSDSKTFTQEELNAVVEQRLNRERAKYGDYDDLKAKAERFDQAEDAQKSELQKLAEKNQKTEDELNSLRHSNMILKACTENGIPTSFADLVHGSTEDEINEIAQKVAKLVKPEAGSEPTKTHTAPGIGTTPGRQTSVPLDEQIAAAEKNGDTQLAMTLKAMKLQTPTNNNL
ncbi:DUF4355 domain-containing protein [Bifidobacterium psychraerophilum]|uniref:capsid assembly scaffolding protein Gp46 family protein n=1 Tax=Bifidobacterium psychraerophilum TaxID=218140 RepID=UPI0039EAB5A5